MEHVSFTLWHLSTDYHAPVFLVYRGDIAGKIEGCDKEALESWDCEKAIAVLGGKHWPEQTRVEVDHFLATIGYVEKSD